MVLDDHLLRDLLSADVSDSLAGVLVDGEPATTNLYYLRLCRSAVAARVAALLARGLPSVGDPWVGFFAHYPT